MIQQPNKPFGVSWYQSDDNANSNGVGPTYQYHLGLWFNNPKVPFNLGCEPKADNRS